MPTIDADDLAAMLSEPGLSDTATYSPEQFASLHPSSKSRTINGLLAKDFVEIGEVETYAPVFICRTSDVSDVSHGAKLTISGVIYTVRGVQDDGTGLMRLILEAP